MANIKLCYDNVADAATFAGSADANYPATNLADTNISKPWRSTGTLPVKGFRLSLAAAATMSALALVNHNLSSSAQVRLRAGTSPLDLDFTTDNTDARLVSSGGTNGTRVDSTGAIGVAAVSPRIDFDSAAPSAIAAKGLLIESAATNLLLNSSTLGTQGVSVTAQTYTLSFYGTGTVTLSGASTAGPLVGTGASNRVTLTFLPTAGTVTFTVTGSVKNAQLETGSAATSWISTTGASVTRTADVVTLTGSNFTGVHNATAGTACVEATSPATGTCPIVSLDDNTAANCIKISTVGTAVRFDVTVGGVSQCAISAGTISAGVPFKVAVAWSANDFAISVSGSAVSTDLAGTLPVVDRLRLGGDPGTSAVLQGYVRRVTRWATRLSNAQLQSLSAGGAGVVDRDTGWLNALQMSYTGVLASDWGSTYDVIVPFTAQSVQYATIDIYDPVNATTYVQVGRVFMGQTTFQPTRNASYGLEDSWIDPSTIVRTPTLKKLASELPRQRVTAFSFDHLTEAEGAQMHDMLGAVGLTREVLYLADPADSAKCQRYGFVGTLSKLDPLRFPYATTRGQAFQVEKKQ